MKINAIIKGRSIIVSNKKGLLKIVLNTDIEFEDIDDQKFCLTIRKDDIKSLIRQLTYKLKEYEKS